METKNLGTCRCGKNISWIVEQRGVLLIDTAENRHLQLSHPEAAVWDLLTRYRPNKRLLRMLAVIADTDMDAAESVLEKCLKNWVAQGWLTCEERP